MQRGQGCRSRRPTAAARPSTWPPVPSVKDKEDRNDMINQPDFNGATPVFLAKQRHGEDAQVVFEYLLNQGSKY